MRIFSEKQRFDQWWLYIITAITLFALLFLVFTEVEDFESLWKRLPFLLIGFLVLLILGGIFFLQLETRIDGTGITATFHPFSFFSKHFKWKEIQKIFVRKYSPIREYGGYGIRGIGNAKAYNVKGNYGIQIVTKNNRRFLIGTNKPTAAKQILIYYNSRKKFN